ncbi:MAG: hypothetical protein ACI8QZ_001476 [Chlamydiales bacterium]|jgi:hypothetical protein
MFQSSTSQFLRPASVLALAVMLATPPAAGAPVQGHGGERRILFVRGGAGSGGFLEGGADEQLCDIDDFSVAPGNHGYGELAEILRADGFVVEQVIEQDSPEGPVHLAGLDLAQVSVLVLGSNNATYSSSDMARLARFVWAGGGVLIASDANWGSGWGDAPSSDQTFLNSFDMVVNQDRGTYVLRRSSGDFVIGGVDRGNHPILRGVDGMLGTADDVNVIDGEGVSPFTVTDLLPGVEPTVLVCAKGTIRVNDNPAGGSTRNATVDDGALVVAGFGAGRVAGHFDRNTFFNLNGAGTSLHRFDNARYARSLFKWLAGPPVGNFGQGKLSSSGQRPLLGARGAPSPSATHFEIVVQQAVPNKPGLFIHGSGYADRPFQGGSLFVSHLRRLPLLHVDPDGKAVQPFGVSAAMVGTQRYFQFWYRDLNDPAGFGSGLSNALRVAFVP